MRRLAVFFLLAGFCILWGAEFKVSGELKKEAFGYIRDNERDADGEYCARVQVNSDIRNLRFDSNRKPVKIVREVGKYFVYLSAGERSLTFLHEDFAAYEYEFPVTLEVNTAYEMTVLRSGYGSADEGLVTITFELNEEDVYIWRGDNPPILTHQRSAQYRLEPGSYKFSFMKRGFGDVSKELEVRGDELISVNLEQGEIEHKLRLPGIVIINSNPVGAEVYLNDQKMGITPWQDELIAGDYELFLKAGLHHGSKQEFLLAEGQALELPVVELKPRYGYWQVQTNEAKIYLDDVYMGSGRIERQKIESGNHKLKVQREYYYDYEEEFLVNDGDEKNFEIELKPAYGILVIKSRPVSEAEVYINGEYAGLTPYTNSRCISGQYRIRVTKALYVGAEETVIVKDEEQVEKTILLSQDFGVLQVNATESEIFINGQKMGQDSYRGNLAAGNYEVIARRDKHREARESVYLGIGKEEEIELEPAPIMGSVTVLSNPAESKGASIWVNGEKEKKATPAILPLMIGQYSIKVQHPEYLEQSKVVNLQEGDQVKLEFDLKTYKGSMLSLRNKWKINSWLGAGVTLLAAGAGVYFNLQGEGYADDYASAMTTAEANKAWDSMNSSYNRRDTCYYISIVPAVYTIYSWFKTGYYGKSSGK